VKSKEHYLAFPSGESANQAADMLPTGEFEISRPVVADGNGWTVIVRLTDSLDPLSLAHWRAQFSQLASDFGGMYTGWGVPPVGVA
jgi:regulator of ribonuclease activity B